MDTKIEYFTGEERRDKGRWGYRYLKEEEKEMRLHDLHCIIH